MTVSHVYPMYVETGTEGITRNVDDLCRALAAEGLAAENRSPCVRLDDLNHRSFHIVQGIRAFRQMFRDLNERDVEALHLHVGIPSMGCLLRAVPAPTRRKAPLILHVWNAVYRAGDDFSDAPARDRFYHRVFNGPLPVAAALGAADAIVVSSRFQRDQLRRIGHHGPVHVIPNGVDADRFRVPTPTQREDARRELGLDGGPVVLYYGHGSPWKGLETFAGALERVLQEDPDAQGLVSVTEYGPGALEIRRRFEKEGLADRVAWLGAADVPTLHAAADVAVVPATAAVGTACHPNVLLESMASGRAVVASRVGSIPEIVRNNENGLLARPADPVHLAQRILRLVQDDRLRHRLGHEARQTMLTHHTWEQAARRLRMLYESLGARNGAPVRVPAAHEREEPTT